MSRSARNMKPMSSLPHLPDCLVKDGIQLPERYVPCEWACDLVTEWQAEQKLIDVGAYPTLSVLLAGPSGVGKTTSARWIANQLQMPVFSMMLSSAIDSYLGSTGKSIDRAFHYVAENRGVLLLDEIDAVATSRKSKSDVGEMWRITNTFIQILDNWHGQSRESLVIATTNLVDSIDAAIRRRFELEISISMPSTRDLEVIAGAPLPSGLVMSQADMRRAVLQAKRKAVLTGIDYEEALWKLLLKNRGQ